MRCIRVREYGSPSVLRLETDAMPSPAADEVLVRVRFAGVNENDLRERRGEQTRELPFVPGVDAVGEVAALGSNVHGWDLGQIVAAPLSSGTYAEWVVLPAVSLAPVPDSISLELAAAVLRDGVLAHRVVNDLAAIGAGDSVLLHGTRDIWPLAQWCDHVGAGMLHEGSPAKCASVIIDFTGGRDWQVLLERAAPGARLVVLDAPADVPDLPVGMLSKLNIHLRVAMLCDRGDDDVRLRNRAWTVWRAVDAGWLMPSPPVVMPLSLAAEAHAHAEADPAVKIILAM